MTIYEKIEFLKFEGRRNLSEWGKDFIDDIYSSVEGLGEPSDADVQKTLTEGQIEKVIELYEEAS